MAVATKKIGIFSGYYMPHAGGVERYTDKLSDALERLGYEIVIVTSNHDGSLMARETVGKRTIYRLPLHNVVRERYPILKTNAEYKQLVRQIDQENIDYYIVNTRFHLTSMVGAKMGKRHARPVLLIEHGTDHFTVGNKVLDFFGGIYEHCLTFVLKRRVSKFYGVSKNCNRWLRHFGITASGVFYNAVNPADRKVINDHYKDIYTNNDEVVITYIGRLIKEKGILNLLDSFMAVKANHPEVKMRLVVAGDGALLEHVRTNYQDPSIDILGRINFEYVWGLYSHTDIFVYPSLYPEGLPTSVLEAGLMGCAVIATPKGGTEEVIIDERHGIIIDGSVASLTEALERLVVDPAKRKELATKIQARVETTFNWDAVAKQVDHEINSFNAG